MPLSNRSINIYQDNIPARPGDNSPAAAAAGGGGGGGGNAAAATTASATAAPPPAGSSPSAAENGSSSGTASEGAGIGQVEMSSQRGATISNPLHADSSSVASASGSATSGAESRKGRIQSALQSISSGVSNLRSMAYAPSSSSSSSSSINNGGASSTWIPSNASLKYQKISDNSVHSSSIMEEKLAAEDSEVEAGFSAEAEDEESGHRGRDKSDSEQGQKKKVYHI